MENKKDRIKEIVKFIIFAIISLAIMVGIALTCLILEPETTLSYKITLSCLWGLMYLLVGIVGAAFCFTTDDSDKSKKVCVNLGSIFVIGLMLLGTIYLELIGDTPKYKTIYTLENYDIASMEKSLIASSEEGSLRCEIKYRDDCSEEIIYKMEYVLSHKNKYVIYKPSTAETFNENNFKIREEN